MALLLLLPGDHSGQGCSQELVHILKHEAGTCRGQAMALKQLLNVLHQQQAKR